MTFAHGSDTVITLDGDDLSLYTKTSTIEDGANSHDITCYGATSEAHQGGLKKGTASMGGTYFKGVTGPRAIIKPLVGSTVTLVRRPEGTGSGLPQDSVDVVVLKYVETNPSNDMIAWSCDMLQTGDLDSTAQAS
jgi:hypothetical protein